MESSSSQVWDYFNKFDRDRVQCKRCLAILSNKQGSTTSMRRHMKHIHKIEMPKKVIHFTQNWQFESA